MTEPRASPVDELARLRAERDYFRAVAERTGRKAAADHLETARLLHALARTEQELRSAHAELERRVDERTAEVVRVHRELAAQYAERAIAEQSARENAELYRLVTDATPSSVSVIGRDGRLAVGNRRALELFGHAEACEVLGRSVLDWVHPDSRATGESALRSVLEGAPLRGLELRLRRRDGASFWGSVNSAAVAGSDGAFRLAILVVTDMTAQKQVEADQLRTQKLESLGVLAGGIAHDFNNLLAAILGNVSAARELPAGDAAARECLEDAERAALRARDLTAQLLAFARGGQPIKRPIAIGRVVREAAQLALRGSGARCELGVPDDVAVVEADEGQIAQVVTNLVLNAAQAAPGGVVGVHVGVEWLESEAGGLAPGRYARVRVEDRGVGIAPEHLARIFDPYFTTRAKGTGLGLTVAFRVVANHGGRIDVESEIGVGTVFTVWLPTTERAQAPATPPRAAPPLAGLRVLVMDDEESLRRVAERVLGRAGCAVVCAPDGGEAVSAYRRAVADGRPFDAVLFDLTVPGGMGGVEAFARIREVDPLARGVVMSGYSSDGALAEPERHGFAAVLRKPFQLESVRAAIAAVTGRR